MGISIVNINIGIENLSMCIKNCNIILISILDGHVEAKESLNPTYLVNTIINHIDTRTISHKV
jgi:hypothetical protein